MNNSQIQKQKIRDHELDILTRVVKKNATYSEILELEKKHKGILIKFWRTNYSSDVSIVNWLTKMENKEKIKQPKEKKIKKDIKPKEVREKIESKEEMSLEKVRRIIDEIKERHGIKH